MTHTTNKQTNTTNQTNNAVEVARKCDNEYWLKKTLYTENRAGRVKEPNSRMSERRRVKGDRQMADGMGSFSTTNKQTQQINVRQNYVGTPQDGLVLAVQKCLQTAQYSYIGELVTH